MRVAMYLRVSRLDQQPFVERFIGSRECFDQVIEFHEAGLRRLMTCSGSYYERSRTHLALDNDTPMPRPVSPNSPLVSSKPLVYPRS